jgi:flavin reductase (DIM6/NTAB) family NADH-FMN oxidoreductase RutF
VRSARRSAARTDAGRAASTGPYDPRVADADDLLAAMRRFASGIAVLTVDDERQPLGVTVGSLVSLSLEPPLVGVSVGVHSPLHTPLEATGEFALSLLAGDQARVAQHFARGGMPPLALWTGVPVRAEVAGPPRIDGALAWLGCSVWAEYAAGDHTIFVARVDDVELGRRATALVYVEGEYRAA